MLSNVTNRHYTTTTTTMYRYTIYHWSTVAANRAIKSIVNHSGNEKLYSFIDDAIQECALKIVENIVNGTLPITKNSMYDYATMCKSGTLKKCYKTVNHLVYTNTNRLYKDIYINDYQIDRESGEIIDYDYIKATKYIEYGYEKFTDIETFERILSELNLTKRQEQAFFYKLDGLTQTQIAHKMNVKQQTVSQYFECIRNKAFDNGYFVKR